MWSVPAKNMKKINMSISYVYDVSIQGNCENAVFTFLPFYKQNIAFFLFLTYHCRVVVFGYSEGESLSYCTCRITFSTIKEYSMGTTQPIRNKDELTAFRMYYKDIHPNSRNYCLIVMGLNTALRISDLLRLKWDNVYNFKHHEFRTHFLINEQKTGKNNYVTLNYNATDALKDYFNERNPNDHEFIFTKNTCRYQPISRTQAYRIVKTAAGRTVQDEHISCHSLRKTFGYHAWKNGTPPALLMDVYNHSSYEITQHYLGIEQDERDEIYLKLEL